MKNRFLFLVGIGALLAMSSCSKDEENLVVKSGEPATLNLTLKGIDVNTRVVGTLASEEDNTIGNVVVGVFRNDGGDVNGYADAIENVTMSSTFVSNKVKCTAGSRDIIVVANASTNDFNQLKTATTKALFLKKVLELTDKVQSKDKLLMTGESDNVTVNKGDENSFPISVTRLVGRVQLISLKSSFTNSYSSAVLNVDRIFLHNALFNYPVDASVPNPKSFSTGWDAAPTPYDETYNENLRDVTNYLLTSNPATSYLNANHYFYTFPNGVSDFSKATKLVISGMFDPDGTAGPIESYPVYYPIVVNGDAVSGNVHTGIGIERNYVYSISATIFRPGVLDPDKPLDPASISLTISVTPWFELPQTNDL